MTVIFRGRRHVVAYHEASGGVWLELTIGADSAVRTFVASIDPDLIMAPTIEDLDLAEAFERGDIGAFEYEDGHTYPANREIKGVSRRKTAPRIH